MSVKLKSFIGSATGRDSHHVEGGHDSQDDEPKPEHDVDLLVDDVEGEDAHGVVPLNCAGGTILVEGALGDSAGNTS